MPPRNKVKLRVTIPANQRSNSRGSFDASYGNSPLTSPSTARSAPPSAISPPSRRSGDLVPRSPSSARPIPPPPAPAKKKVDAAELEREDTEKLESLANAPPSFDDSKRTLAKQLSMHEMSMARDIAREKRRRQNSRKERRRYSISGVTQAEEPYQPIAAGVTDADLHDLKGSIELGFGFNEEEGQKLCNTLPALDLYFAVNRTLSLRASAPHPPPMPLIKIPSAPQIRMQSPIHSPRGDQDSWKIGSPAAGDDPQQVKTKLRHWAQAVAFSIIQSS